MYDVEEQKAAAALQAKREERYKQLREARKGVVSRRSTGSPEMGSALVRAGSDTKQRSAVADDSGHGVRDPASEEWDEVSAERGQLRSLLAAAVKLLEEPPTATRMRGASARPEPRVAVGEAAAVTRLAAFSGAERGEVADAEASSGPAPKPPPAAAAAGGVRNGGTSHAVSPSKDMSKAMRQRSANTPTVAASSQTATPTPSMPLIALTEGQPSGM